MNPAYASPAGAHELPWEGIVRRHLPLFSELPRDLLPDCYRTERHRTGKDGIGRQSPGLKPAQDGTPEHRTTRGEKR